MEQVTDNILLQVHLLSILSLNSSQMTYMEWQVQTNFKPSKRGRQHTRKAANIWIRLWSGLAPRHGLSSMKEAVHTL